MDEKKEKSVRGVTGKKEDWKKEVLEQNNPRENLN